MDKIEQLRAIVADEALGSEERGAAATLLAQIEPANNETVTGIFASVLASASQRAAEYRERENAAFKVCPSCYRKQPMDRLNCELCGNSPLVWEPAVTGTPRRAKWVAAATTFAPEELNWYVANDAMDTSFAKHCARILELRGIPRARAFWERAGFDFDGRPLAG